MNPENVNDLSLVLCDILLKLNRTGTKFNKRIFCLKDGFIFYYNVPSNFISNNFDSLKGFPNAGIAIIDVLKMYGHHHHKLHCFSIEFPEDKLITYKISKKMNIRRYAINNISEFSNNQINEEKIDNKSIFKIIRWIFSIYPSDNKAKPLKFWLNSLFNAKIEAAQKTTVLEELTRFSTLGNSAMIMNKHDIAILHEEFLDKTMEKEYKMNIREKKKSKISPDQQIHLQKLFKKIKGEMKFNWDFIYFIHLNSFLRVEDLTNSVPSNPDESKMHIFDIIGKFKSVCLEIAKEVIDDLLLPRYAQKYINYLVSQPETSLFDSNELLYEIKEKSLNLRVCSYKNNSDLKIKSLKHEFKTMKFLADHLISIQEKKPDFRYYVPLSSKITYKGYVALITSLPPLESPPKLSVIKIDKSQQSYEEEYSLKLGPTKEGHYILDKKIHNDLILLAKSLNLQPHHYKWSLKEEPLPIALSISTQIHLANKKSWMEFSAFNQVNDIEDLNCLVETLKTQKPEQFEIYYLKNVADVFPLEIGVDSNNPKDFKQQRFRPEFIIRYPTSLSSDIFLNPLSNPESEEQNMEGYHAAEKIKSKSLEIYLKDLLEFKIKDIPISSRNFKTTLHSYGINMRHLGELCKKCVGESLAFLKNMCEIEMISRVCKVIFQTKLVNFCENFAKNKFYFEENNKNTSIDNMMQTSIIINQSKQFLQNSFEDSANEENINSESNFNGSNSVLDIQTELIMELSEEIIDFFNLIFGKGKENELFWKEIVQKKIKEKFGFCFNLDGFENFQGLYEALLYHLMLKMKQKDIGFFEEDLPFDIKDFLGLEAEIESYELLPLKDRYENDCLFQLETEKRMGNFDYLRPSFCHIIDGFIEFGKINTASKELDSAFKEIKDIKSYNNIEIVHLLYLKIKILFNNNQIDQTFEVFRQILEILKRSLKNNHPIFPIFYCLMAEHFLKVCDYNNALFLYKSSLFAFIRVFGKNAPILADVYCNLAKIYCQLGDFDEEYANYQSALFLYEICKFENKRYFYDISWKMSNLCKMKGLIKESIQFGLSCVEVLETDAKSFLEELIDCYLLIIEQTFNLNDFSSGILFCDDCSRLLNEMEKNSYNTYRKLFEWGLKAYFSRSSHDKQEFFKKIATKMQENLDKENELYKNDEKYMQMIILKALDALANETKLFEKFSQFISNHFENIFKNKDSINLMNINNDRINDTGSKVQEIIHSLEILENLLIVIPLQKFLNFFD